MINIFDVLGYNPIIDHLEVYDEQIKKCRKEANMKKTQVMNILGRFLLNTVRFSFTQ